MGRYDYRPPEALGGIVSTWIFRKDLEWLYEQSRIASRWMSTHREVDYTVADLIHGIVVARARQLAMELQPRRKRQRKASQRPAEAKRRRALRRTGFLG